VSAAPWEPLAVVEVAELFRDYPGRWWIAGGQALELFVGHAIRTHGDIDVLVLRSEQAPLQEHLQAWDLRVAHDGKLAPWRRHERLDLPRHSVWARRPSDRAWRFQILFGEDTAGAWHFRRDPAISLPLDELGAVTTDGIPYLRPEVVLLFKAKEPRAEDELDFTATLPKLDSRARERLRAWLPGEPHLIRRLGRS
jgi:hypothetical protein